MSVRENGKEEGNMNNDFDFWMARVDAATYALALVSVYDLPDLAFADLYEDGLRPVQVAKLALGRA
jgi:hypothetical protein